MKDAPARLGDLGHVGVGLHFRKHDQGARIEGVDVEPFGREQGGVGKLAAAGITAHSVFRFTEMLDTLVESGRLSEDKKAEVLKFLRNE